MLLEERDQSQQFEVKQFKCFEFICQFLFVIRIKEMAMLGEGGVEGKSQRSFVVWLKMDMFGLCFCQLSILGIFFGLIEFEQEGFVCFCKLKVVFLKGGVVVNGGRGIERIFVFLFRYFLVFVGNQVQDFFWMLKWVED